MIPAIETERLVLRGHTAEDFPHSAALWGDAEVTRFIGGRPFTEEECWARLHRYAGHWALLGFGYWLVQEKATGRFVGELGFMDLKRDIDPPFHDAPEAGWVVCPSAQGKGYASEGLRGALGWAEARWGRARTVCMISPDNQPSLGVAQKAGYSEFARTSYKGAPVVLLER